MSLAIEPYDLLAIKFEEGARDEGLGAREKGGAEVAFSNLTVAFEQSIQIGRAAWRERA